MSIPHLMVTVFGLGHMRPASGTWGSTPPPALALLLVWALSAGGLSTADHVTINVALLLLAVLFGWACVHWGLFAEIRFRKKDPGEVVADEVAGQVIPLLFLPWVPFTDGASALRNVMLAGGAFLAFRLMDITKPPPARGFERLRGGWGVLVDDLVAGVYAMVVVQIVVRFLFH